MDFNTLVKKGRTLKIDQDNFGGIHPCCRKRTTAQCNQINRDHPQMARREVENTSL